MSSLCLNSYNDSVSRKLMFWKGGRGPHGLKLAFLSRLPSICPLTPYPSLKTLIMNFIFWELPLWMLYLYHFHHFPPQAPLMFLPTFIISSLLLLHAYPCVHTHLHICTHVYTTESVCHCLYVHVSRVDHVDLGNSSGNPSLDHTDCPSLSSHWPLAALYMGTGPCSLFLV